MDNYPLIGKPGPRSMSRRTAIGAGVACAAAFTRSSPSTAMELQTPPVFATSRHQFTLVMPTVQLTSLSVFDQAGVERQFAAAAGRVTLLGFWATWCEACFDELRLLDDFHASGKCAFNVAAVSIDGPDRQSDVELYLAKIALTSLPIYLDPYGRVATLSSRSAAPLSLFGQIPVTYLITPSGRAVGFIAGTADWHAPDAQALISYYSSN